MSMRWFYVYPRLTPLVGCFYVYGVFLHLSHTDLASVAFLYMFFVSVPGLGGGVWSWRHHRLTCVLCVCARLGGGVGSRCHHRLTCVLCVCVRPWWWCGVLVSSHALCVFFVSVPGLGGGVGSLCHHRLSVCSLCLCQALVVACGPGVITG